MDVNENNNAALDEEVLANSIRAYPFCGSPGQLTGADGYGFGVACGQCGVGFPAIQPSRESAIALWGHRQGTASFHGGLSTRGISIRKKRRACRRNLRRARQVLALKRVRAKIEAVMPQLKAARAAQLAEVELAAAESRAKLVALEPQILADPVLARVYALLRPSNAVPASSSQTSPTGQPPPSSSPLRSCWRRWIGTMVGRNLSKNRPSTKPT